MTKPAAVDAPEDKGLWARVHYHVLRFGSDFLKLSEADALAYLKLWVTCVKFRRSWFRKDEYEGEWTTGCLADRVGVTRERLLSVIASGIASGLLSRGPGGTITVCGVKTYHPKLRGWDKDRFLPLDIDGEIERDQEYPPDPPCQGGSDASHPNPEPSRAERKAAFAAFAERARAGIRFTHNNVQWQARVHAADRVSVYAVESANADPVVLTYRSDWQPWAASMQEGK